MTRERNSEILLFELLVEGTRKGNVLVDPPPHLDWLSEFDVNSQQKNSAAHTHSVRSTLQAGCCSI